MREIKFRGWDEKNKEMVDNINLLFSNHLNECFEEYEECGLKIMQYTGLKDKNGVEIYEGDIIKMYDVNCQLLWDVSGCLYYIKGDDLVTELEYCRIKDIEVVGNIYENAEMVKEK